MTKPSYDIVFGAPGQDGRILIRGLLRKGRSVISFGRSDPAINHRNHLFFKLDLMDISNALPLLDLYSINTVYYFAAVHSSQEQFTGLNEEHSKRVNCSVPAEIYQFLSLTKNIRHFIYASSKLVFERDTGPYHSLLVRRNDNSYSHWKNEFEKIFDESVEKNISRTLIWFSNHDSIYRDKRFLLPRLAKKLAHSVKTGFQLDVEHFEFENDWGCAIEFMDAVVQYSSIERSEHRGEVYKQFLSNQNSVDVNKLIKNCYLALTRANEQDGVSTNSEIGLSFLNSEEMICMPQRTSLHVLYKMSRHTLLTMEKF